MFAVGDSYPERFASPPPNRRDDGWRDELSQTFEDEVEAHPTVVVRIQSTSSECRQRRYSILDRL